MEIITVNSFKEFANYEFDYYNLDKDIPDSANIIFCVTDNIKKLFDKIEKIDRQFIVISANSDFSLVLQRENEVNDDIQKRLSFVDYSQLSKYRGYIDFKVGKCCAEENCNWEDKFSLKSYAHTVATFNKIPSNVLRWFLTNNNTDEEKIESIPFGILPESKALIEEVMQEEIIGEDKIYCNFESYTSERANLKHFYSTHPDFTVVRDANLPRKEYLRQIRRHNYVLSPYGNGTDSYRTYETLYLWSLPILQRGRFSHNMRIPCITYPDLFDIRGISAENYQDGDINRIDLNWWRTEIEKWKNKL